MSGEIQILISHLALDERNMVLNYAIYKTLHVFKNVRFATAFNS